MKKDSPTYSGPTEESWIDITVTTINSALFVQSWEVSEECTQSDHNLILFDLRIQRNNKNLHRTAGNFTRKFATQVGNWNLFEVKVKQCSQQWRDWVNSATTKETLDKSITEIWSKLGEIGKECFPPFLPKTKYAPWWSPKLNALTKQVNALKRRVKRCKNQDLKEIFKTPFKAVKTLYKSDLIKAKKDSWKKFCEDSTKTTPWKMYKVCKAGFTRQPGPSSLILQNGFTTTSEKETARALLHKFFPDDSTAQDSGKQRKIREHTAELGPQDAQLDPNFTEHEVDEVIRNLDDSKCPGPDGMDSIIVKRMHKCLPKFGISLFNKCFVLGCLPKEWKKAWVIAIPKSDKTKLHSIQGYQGISLLSIPGKCLENLVVERLNYFQQTTGQIPSLQFGFTAGRSTADAIKTVIEFVEHSRKLGLKCCLLVLDIAGAFDNTWHPGILARLWKLKCPPNIYSMVRDFLSDRTAHVTLGNSISSKCITNGCPQGSVFGPTVWNIIISDLIALLSNAPNLKIIVFAGDIMVDSGTLPPSHPKNTKNHITNHRRLVQRTQTRDLQR
jgi:hypothetical protein